MRYEYTINWTPKSVVETLDSINNFMSNMGFKDGKLVSSVDIGTFRIESPVEISENLLKEYLVEATKIYEKSLNGKIYLERI